MYYKKATLLFEKNEADGFLLEAKQALANIRGPT